MSKSEGLYKCQQLGYIHIMYTLQHILTHTKKHDLNETKKRSLVMPFKKGCTHTCNVYTTAYVKDETYYSINITYYCTWFPHCDPY